MSKSRLPLYLGLGAVGGVGYYLYQSGGDIDQAKATAKADAHKARAHVPGTSDVTKAEKKGEELGDRATAYVEEVLDTANAKAKDANSRFADGAKESLDKIEQIGQDTARSMGTTVDQLDRKVEQKASEAKKSVSGWFGGGK